MRAVSGVLGGVAFRRINWERELTWIDEQVKGKPYGVDIIVPAKFEARAKTYPAASSPTGSPDEYRPSSTNCWPPTTSRSSGEARIAGSSLSGDTGAELLDVALESSDQVDGQRSGASRPTT